MSVLEVFWYLANGTVWFLAGMFTPILVRSWKDKCHG